MKPASPPKAKTKTKTVAVEESEEEMPKAPRARAPVRKYVELSDEEEAASMYVDDE